MAYIYLSCQLISDTDIESNMDQITVKEVKILETVEDIQERREQVLNRYVSVWVLMD